MIEVFLDRLTDDNFNLYDLVYLENSIITPLLKNNYSIDYIEESNLELIIDKWLSLQDSNLVEISKQWVIENERQILDYAYKKIQVRGADGSYEEVEPSSKEFKENDKRRRLYKGYI